MFLVTVVTMRIVSQLWLGLSLMDTLFRYEE